MENLNGQVIMLIIFVVISGVKWFLEQLKKRNEDPYETSESLEDIYDEFREEIRQRQTLVQPAPQENTHQRHAEDIFTPHHEEFAQPHSSTPPPLPPETDYLREYQADPPPPPVFTIKKPTLTAEEKAALARIHEQSLASPSQQRLRQRRSHASLRQLLASPKSARQAIILHEVLGKPKSLQTQ